MMSCCELQTIQEVASVLISEILEMCQSFTYPQLAKLQCAYI